MTEQKAPLPLVSDGLSFSWSTSGILTDHTIACRVVVRRVLVTIQVFVTIQAVYFGAGACEFTRQRGFRVFSSFTVTSSQESTSRLRVLREVAKCSEVQCSEVKYSEVQ